jgi:iron complex outermembrane receptor protein
LRLIIGGQYLYSVRQNQYIPLSARDTEDDSLTFREFSPQIGLLWNTSKHQQWYVNLSQAQEIPGINDLTSAGVLPFDPLDTQNSTTFEVGTRGQYQQWAWDVSVYRSEVEDKFIAFTEGFVTFTVNSESDTIHQGIEAGLDWQPTISLTQSGVMY